MTANQKNPDATSTASKGLRRRLIRGFGATALSPVVTATIQLSCVPLLLHAWGAAKYGDWLLLSAIPSYLTLSDLGFGDASGSDMSMRVAADDREGALETFQSSWVLVTSVSVVTMLVAFVSVWWIPWQHWLRLSSVSSIQAADIVIILAAYVVVAQQNGVAESGYRCDGNFASGTLWMTIQRIAEALVATTVALFGGSLLAVAASYLFVRCLGTFFYAIRLRHLSPWLQYGIRHAQLKTIRDMAAPAFGFMAFPFGNALSMQGLILVIGARLGPIPVVAFSTLRTLSRINLQLIAVIAISLWPELSGAFGTGNIPLARKLHRHACQASLMLSLFGGLLLWILGPFIYRLWIRSNVSFDATCFHILLLVVVTNSLWSTSAVILMSINKHCRIAVTYAGVTLLSLGLAWLLIRPLGIAGAAVALLVTDAWMTGLVLRTALDQVQDTLKMFVAAFFAIPHFRHTLQPAPEA